MSEKTKQEYISDGLDVFAEGKYHEAIDIYRKALDIDETYVEGHLAIAKAYELMGALDEAIEMLKAGITHHPSEPFLHTSLSQCLQKQGLIPEAEEEMAIAHQLQQSGA
ncbi:tetratricopeptide repeat protein [Candidatus Poribacteria bacterium]|jgi:tetratricopeptide (TPR) repeat protein|nr:tetratricopeptide repeat protein [Candidatus Poribacteria bacterium]MBT5534603.1 tetratricopeptide repeat protein [Candidatus Poribacteria bacterium]MBT5713229.1 tetratricopeptide repeat protein [Candidatus Poribacteria bacterium]MBT7807720.1 tetratricopeptide repeat protein [Candidatus Poribacteria bacterium]